MKGSYCLVIVTILITALRVSTSVKVVVIRDSSSRSVEESDEKSSGEESEEIDFLLDLIRKKESSERKSQPVTKTIKFIRKQQQGKKKPSLKEIASESTIQKETAPKQTIKKPSEHKEYHVHYHSHQHQLPEEPLLKSDEDKLRPVYWDLGTHVEDYQPFVKKSRKLPMLLPFSDNEKLNGFNDYSSLLNSKLMSSASNEYVIGDAGYNHFSSTYESEMLAKKLESDRNRKLMKKYRALLQSAATARPKINYSQKDSYEMSQPAKVLTKKQFGNMPRLEKETFPNGDRFAGFTDFSSIESPQPNPLTQQSSKAEDASKELYVKDKPRMARPLKPKKFRKNAQQVKQRHGVMIAPAKALQSQNMELFRNRLPRVLNAPGGIPMHVERLNEMKANSKNVHYLNALESGPRLLHVHPLNRPDAFTSRLFNGWYLERILR